MTGTALTRSDGLIENVRGVQAEDGNLIAAGVGDDRELIEFVDGDASGSGRCAGRGGGYATIRKKYFFEHGEVRDVRTDAGTSDHIESEVARTCKDIKCAARRAGIRSRNRNSYVDFVAIHKGEIPESG